MIVFAESLVFESRLSRRHPHAYQFFMGVSRVLRQQHLSLLFSWFSRMQISCTSNRFTSRSTSRCTLHSSSSSSAGCTKRKSSFLGASPTASMVSVVLAGSVVSASSSTSSLFSSTSTSSFPPSPQSLQQKILCNHHHLLRSQIAMDIQLFVLVINYRTICIIMITHISSFNISPCNCNNSVSLDFCR